jgi:histidinol phosphatase-like PHP family hydrolase
MRKVIEAAVKHDTAIEITGGKIPKLPFLQIAKAAGAKFSFGSNGRYPNMGKIDYCLEMAQTLGLTPADIFVPSPKGPRAARRNT